jgi:LacI family repressor for deo operon, udp, cdd, tsx, nupC, and nupG
VKNDNPTLRDVAALAGVSHQTVSRVINGEAHVSPETRSRVDTAIQTLHFRPNALARHLARGRSNLLAAIAPNLVDYTFASSQEGAEFEARKQGYYLVTSSAPTINDFEALIEQLIGHRRVDGVIVFNPYLDSRHTLLPGDIPMVFCGGREREDIPYCVYLDNFSGSMTAARHLIDLGHTRIGEVTGPLSEDCAQERHRGFEQALFMAKIEIEPGLTSEGDWSATSGHKIFQKWAEDRQIPTAVLVQNDRMAVGVLRAARDLGLKIPEQLSVIGFDDMPLAAYFDPPLTSMRQDTFGIGCEAARLLVRVIEAGNLPPQHIRFPAELVLRASTAPIERR